MMIHLELWKYLERIVEEFYGDAEEYYMNLYGLLPRKRVTAKV